MKFIKLTNCENDRAVLVKLEDIASVWSSEYKANKSCSYVSFKADANMPNLYVWETIDYLEELLK